MKKSEQSVYPHKIIDFRESAAQCRTVYEGEEYGLNKLEYFSGLAMQGMLANSKGDGLTNPASIASLAVKQAKCLIEELDRQNK